MVRRLISPSAEVPAVGYKAFALTSCVAALPAAILSYVLVRYGFFQHSGDMNIKTLLMTAFTLALSMLIMFIPGGILVYGRPRKPKAAKAAPKIAAAAVSSADESSEEASVAELGSSSDISMDALNSSDEESLFESSDEDILGSEPEIVSDEDDLELDATTAFSTPAKGSDLELADSDTFGDDEVSEFEEIEDEVIFEDDDDDEPPSRKKKR